MEMEITKLSDTKVEAYRIRCGHHYASPLANVEFVKFNAFPWKVSPRGKAERFFKTKQKAFEYVGALVLEFLDNFK